MVTEYERKSYSQERTFNRDLSELHSLKVQLWKMSKGVAEDLKRGGLAGGTVAIKLRYSDFTTLTRQMTQAVPTDDAIEIYRAALILLERAWEPGRPVRLLGVGAHQLSEPTGQLPLFDMGVFEVGFTIMLTNTPSFSLRTASTPLRCGPH